MKRRIFIVDDEPGIIQVARILLEGEGYAVQSEINPEVALGKLKNDPPDLIILDVCMPWMNGLDLCRALKNDPKLKSVPVMFMSIKSEESDVVVGLELGADDYVQKPIREKELASHHGLPCWRVGLPWVTLTVLAGLCLERAQRTTQRTTVRRRRPIPGRNPQNPPRNPDSPAT